MSINQGSSGFPEVNVHRRTTKVNLWMIAAIVMFLTLTGGAAFWISRRAAEPAEQPQKTADGLAIKHP